MLASASVSRFFRSVPSSVAAAEELPQAAGQLGIGRAVGLGPQAGQKMQKGQHFAITGVAHLFHAGLADRR